MNITFNYIKKLSTFSVIQDVDKLFMNLGQEAIHAPLYLCWALIRQLYVEDEQSQVVTRKLGNLSLHLGVFSLLMDLVNTEPFNGKAVMYYTQNLSAKPW